IGSGESIWPMPKLSISDLSYHFRPDRFVYTGNGVAGGFSGGPILDTKGFLLGVHQGETDDGLHGLWAQRLTPDALRALELIGFHVNFGSGVTPQPAVDQSPLTWGPIVGGMGGDPFKSACQNDEALVGIVGRTGDFRLFNVGPLCSKVSAAKAI